MFNKKNIMQFIEKQMLLCKFFDLFAIHLFIYTIVKYSHELTSSLCCVQ